MRLFSFSAFRATALGTIILGSGIAHSQTFSTVLPAKLEERINDSAYLVTGTSSALYNNLHALRLGFSSYALYGPPQTDHGYGVTLYVKADSGLGIGTGASTPAYMASMPSSFGYWTGPTYKVYANGSPYAWLSIASTAALPGATFKVVVVEASSFTDRSKSPPEYNVSYRTSYVEYLVKKISATATSIDTRKTYGQPNLEGELPGDANAPPAEIGFANWVHKGGLFVGNAPWTTNDQSGLSRIQVYSAGDPGAKVAALSMFQQGHRKNFNASVEVGAFFPKSTDVNFNVAAGDVRWPTRWNVNPRAAAGSPPDYSQDPYRPFSGYDPYVPRLLGGTNYPDGEFVCWPLSQTGLYGDEIPENALTKIVLAVKDEANWAGAGGSGWRYFANAPFAALQSGKYGDTAPKIWTVTPQNYVDGGIAYNAPPAWMTAAAALETSASQ